MTRYKLGTRGSKLALKQAQMAIESFQKKHPELDIEYVIIKSEGDQSQQSLQAIGGQGVFTAALSQALINHDIDLAVHSLKDLPTQQDNKLTLGAILKRDDPRDLFISRHPLKTLPFQSRIGTGSLRRKAQFKSLRPDCMIIDIRGNIDTRLKKIISGECDGILLSAAGINRLKNDTEISELVNQFVAEHLDVNDMTPAVGQGTIAIECRRDDTDLLNYLKPLDDLTTRQCVEKERSLLAQLQGGCQIPFAAHLTEKTVHLVAADPETGECFRYQGLSDEAEIFMDSLLAESHHVLSRFQ